MIEAGEILVGQRLIGCAPAFLVALKDLARLAQSRAVMLIEGETGTGKELAARAAHYLGAGRDHPFAPVNCGAIPDGLIENELFGHRAGAYSGHGGAAEGLVERAGEGALFLDEVDALTPRGQAALLRFLQDGEYRRLGGGEVRRAKCRVIAASNAALADAVADGRFRQDLYYRLAVGVVTLPPLRARPGDAALLATHFLDDFAEAAGRSRRFSPAMLDGIERADWPGNVRELRAFVERQSLLCDDEVIDRVHGGAGGGLSRPCATSSPPAPSDRASRKPFAEAKAEAIAEFEQRYLRETMAIADGNVSRAARLAGKERRTFARLLRKHAIPTGVADFS